MKKTTAKKTAKKATKKTIRASKAFEEALGIKPPDNREEQFKKLAEIKGELNDDGRRAIVNARIESQAVRDFLRPQEPHTEEELGGEELWPDYSPSGMSGEDPEGAFLPTVEPVKASQPTPGHIVPESTPDAPQHDVETFYEKIDENFKEIKATREKIQESLNQIKAKRPLGQPTTSAIDQAASCIESLIDALNFAHSKGMLRKLQEKDTQIIKARIATGRKLIEQLRA